MFVFVWGYGVLAATAADPSAVALNSARSNKDPNLLRRTLPNKAFASKVGGPVYPRWGAGRRA